MNLDKLRISLAKEQKSGIPFICSSITIWTIIAIICSLGLNVNLQNTIVLCCACLLLPLAWGYGKLMHVNVFDKGNELYKAGLIFAINQILYIFIAMWVFSVIPEKMIMVYAIITGAHFLPYSWLYKSTVYLIFSIAMTLIMLAVGMYHPASTVALAIVGVETILAIALWFETKKK